MISNLRGQQTLTKIKTEPLASRFARILMQSGFRCLSKWSPDLAASAAERLFTTPRHFQRPKQETRNLLSAQQFSVDSSRGKLVGWSWGKGPTVVLLHGWEGRGSQMGSFVEPLTRNGYRAVTFDAPAHGDSEGKRTTMLSIAHATRELLNLIGPIHGIIAHSFGSAISTLLLNVGISARRVVYISSPDSMLHYSQQFARVIGLSDTALLKMRDSIYRKYRHDWSPFANSWEDLVQSKMARSFAVPLLLIHDRDDRIVPIEDGIKISKAWPHAQLLTTEGLGHRRVLRDETVIDKTIAFLSEQTSL